MWVTSVHIFGEIFYIWRIKLSSLNFLDSIMLKLTVYVVFISCWSILITYNHFKWFYFILITITKAYFLRPCTLAFCITYPVHIPTFWDWSTKVNGEDSGRNTDNIPMHNLEVLYFTVLEFYGCLPCYSLQWRLCIRDFRKDNKKEKNKKCTDLLYSSNSFVYHVLNILFLLSLILHLHVPLVCMSQ